MPAQDFDSLFTKTRPHILEIVCLCLDYETLRNCVKVNTAWRSVLTSKAFKKEAKSVFKEEILKEEEKLLAALEEGNANEARQLLSIGIMDEDCADRRGMTPLHWAAQKGLDDVVQLLIDRGADLNRTNIHGHTPLHRTGNPLNIAVVKLLLDNGADPDKGGYGYVVLHRAAGLGYTDVVQLLLERGVDPNTSDQWGHTALHIGARARACHKVHDVVKLLLDKGADPKKTDEYGATPLHCAAAEGKKDVAKLFLDHGADPNMVENDMFRTPLHLAALQNRKDVVQLLLDTGADPYKANVDGETPLICAQKKGYTDIVTMLKRVMT